MLRPVLFAAICGTIIGGMATADEDTIQKKLAAAKGEYEKAIGKAQVGLIDALKKKADAAQKAGDLTTLEKVEAEAKAFKDTSELPRSVPTKAYEAELRRARAKLEDAYAAAVKEYTKAGQREQAKAAQQELDEFKKGGASAVAEKWTPLFNGKDLTGWKTHTSQPGNWQVKNGVLIGSGPGLTSHLYTKRGDYKNFHLRLEARRNDGGNSGVYFRTPFGPKKPGNRPRWLIGYNAKFDEKRAGGLLVETGEPTTLVRDITPPLLANEWVTLEAIIKEFHVVIKVNGQTTTDYNDEKKSFVSGHIALQQHTPKTVVEFRKIEIKELP